MSLASFVTQVRADLQCLDDYGLATQVDISEEIRLSSQAVLRATVQFGERQHYPGRSSKDSGFSGGGDGLYGALTVKVQAH